MPPSVSAGRFRHRRPEVGEGILACAVADALVLGAVLRRPVVSRTTPQDSVPGTTRALVRGTLSSPRASASPARRSPDGQSGRDGSTPVARDTPAADGGPPTRVFTPVAASGYGSSCPTPCRHGPVRPPVRPADQEDNGVFPSLLRTVRLLRGATARPDADPVLDAKCATALLQLWRAHGDPALLGEALGHARRSARRAPAGAGHRAVAAVLRAQADEAVRDGDPALALRLLARADTAYAAACAAAADTPALCRLIRDRVSALEARWSLSGESAALHQGIGMLEAVADSVQPPHDIALLHGRLLRRLAATSDNPDEARDHATRSVHSLTAAVSRLRPGQAPELVLELAEALLGAGPDHHEELHAFLTRQLGEASGVQHARLLVRSARLSLALHQETRDRRHLTVAEAHLTRSLARLPREDAEHTASLELLATVLLRTVPCSVQDTGRAVSALRACVRATAPHDPALAERRALLGRALMARYRLGGDRIDLREAEHHLRLAADTGGDPLSRATRLIECGRARITAAAGLSRPARLDDAVTAFRSAIRVAREVTEVPGAAARTPRRTAQAVVLTARALHLMGTAHEAAQRPSAAHAAYRRAVQEWTVLPAGMEVTGAPAPRDSDRCLAALRGTSGLAITTGDA